MGWWNFQVANGWILIVSLCFQEANGMGWWFPAKHVSGRTTPRRSIQHVGIPIFPLFFMLDVYLYYQRPVWKHQLPSEGSRGNLLSIYFCGVIRLSCRIFSQTNPVMSQNHPNSNLHCFTIYLPRKKRNLQYKTISIRVFCSFLAFFTASQVGFAWPNTSPPRSPRCPQIPTTVPGRFTPGGASTSCPSATAGRRWRRWRPCSFWVVAMKPRTCARVTWSCLMC